MTDAELERLIDERIKEHLHELGVHLLTNMRGFDMAKSIRGVVGAGIADYLGDQP